METSLPIVFEMDVHCIACAKSIRRSLYYMFGASMVTASTSTGMVVVRGGSHLDPCTLKCFLERFAETRHHGGRHRGRRGVSTLSDGGRPQRCHFAGITHLGPPNTHYYEPQPYYYDHRNGHRGGSWYDDDVDQDYYYDDDNGGGCSIM